MRNLWLFLVNYYAFFLFIFLETIAISLVISNNDYQRSTVLNSANTFSGNLYTMISNATGYLSLGRVNDSLVVENIRLRNELRSAFYNNTPDTLKRVDSNLMRQYTFIAAQVVNNSVVRRSNYLTLNRGLIHGIRKNMGVICDQGIVGIVRDVSTHFCTVISVLHKDTRISAKIDSTGDFGSLAWNGMNPRIATLSDIPTHVQFKKGAKIVTTSFSSIFPQGVAVGIIKDFGIKEGDNFYSIDVELSTDFSKLSYVYIIANSMSIEQSLLEQKLPQE